LPDRQAPPVAAGAKVAALLQDRRATLAVDRPVDPAAAQQRRVGRVDDRVDLLGRDVAGDQLDPHRINSTAKAPDYPCP
jgi:hypothetical protein